MSFKPRQNELFRNSKEYSQYFRKITDITRGLVGKGICQKVWKLVRLFLVFVC